CVSSGVQAACRDSTVTQELLKEGFHRDLLVKAELGEDAGGCAVAARIHLPPGIYVDPYELASLQQHNLTKAVLIPDVIDVEAPEYSSTDLVLLLSLDPDPHCSHCFQASVPLHGRYQRPARREQHVLVRLDSPELLLCCYHGHLPGECWKPAGVAAPCPAGNITPCQWYSTAQRPAQEEPVLSVPVGLSEHTFLVCATTLLTTVLCSSLIFTATCRYGHF
ncbi:Phosphatidylinositol-glycan biosynthesis class X protein, partial [Acanthisitta chloris]